MSPEEYLRRNLGSNGMALSWLLPLLYVLLALTLVAWAGMRHSNRTRRGRALFVFTIGIVLIVLASAFFLLRAVGTTQFVGVGAAATLLGCAMLVVAGGLAAAQRRGLVRRAPRAADDPAAARRTRPPASRRRHRRASARAAGVPGRRADVPDLRRAVPRGDDGRRRATPSGRCQPAHRRSTTWSDGIAELSDFDTPDVAPEEQARAIAEWIYAGRGETDAETQTSLFPGLGWLRQPTTYSDREWILAIAKQYRQLDRAGVAAGS